MPRSRSVKFYGHPKPKKRRASQSLVSPTKNDVGSVTNATSPFLNLPTELKLQVVEHLDLQDVLNVRRMSASWAASGCHKMFPLGFSVRPHREDMDRLRAVCGHEEIVKSIKELTFYAGDMDLIQFMDAIHRDEYLTVAQRRKTVKIITAITHDRAVTRKHCNEAALQELFPKLPNLRSLTISSQMYPFWDCDAPLEETWLEMGEETEQFDKTNPLDPDISRKRYVEILSAALNAKVQVERLVLDSLPIDCLWDINYNLDDPDETLDFRTSPKTVLNLTKEFRQALKCVQVLDLGLIGSGDSVYRSRRLARRIGEFIGAFKGVRSLDLAWNVEDDVQEEFSEAWEATFFNNKFPHLERLRMEDLDSEDTRVLPFLYKHSATLKCLQFREDDPWRDAPRSTKDLLTDLRDNLNLEKFDYVDYQGCELYNEEWGPAEHLAGTNKIVTSSKLLEFYVTKKCPWPMMDDNPRERGWRRKFMGNDLSFLELSEAEMADLMGDDWETDRDSDEEGEDEEDEDEEDDDDMEDDDGWDEDEGDDDGDFDHHHHHHYHDHLVPLSMMSPWSMMFQTIMNGGPGAPTGGWEDMDEDMDSLPDLIAERAEGLHVMPELGPLAESDPDLEEMPPLVPGEADEAEGSDDEMPDLI